MVNKKNALAKKCQMLTYLIFVPYFQVHRSNGVHDMVILVLGHQITLVAFIEYHDFTLRGTLWQNQKKTLSVGVAPKR